MRFLFNTDMRSILMAVCHFKVLLEVHSKQTVCDFGDTGVGPSKTLTHNSMVHLGLQIARRCRVRAFAWTRDKCSGLLLGEDEVSACN